MAFKFNPLTGKFDLTGSSGAGTVTSVASADGSITVTNPTDAVDLAVVKAPKLTTGRTISISGDLAYTSPAFDGTANVTAIGTLATVNSNVGSFTYSNITVNAKGLITAASSGVAPSATLTVGTTTITSGTSTRILYDNAGVLGEYTLTGSGTVVAMQTAPTFVTSITSPLIIGGTGTTQTLIHKTTTGVGAAGADHIFQVGNNGATEAMRILNSGFIGVGTASPNEQLEITKNFRLPATTSTTGIIYQDTNRFIHTFGTDSTFLGVGAGNLTNTGVRNTGVGFATLASITSGEGNTGIGWYVLNSTTSGTGNTGIGRQALQNTTGNYNVAVGWLALQSNTTGSNNTALGTQALNSNTTASNGTAVGYGALTNNTTGDGNVAFGVSGLYQNTTGNNNVSIGGGLGNNTTGNASIAVGQYSLSANVTGSNNTATGVYALTSSTGDNNTAFGYQSLLRTTASNSTALGSYAGNNTTGGNNTFIGYYSGYTGTAETDSVFLGAYSGYYETGNNKFFINNVTSVGSNEADARTKAMMYGVFASTPASQTLRINASVGIQVNPTAYLHLPAGTTAASTSPLKFTSGSLQTTAEAGAVEFLTDKWYGTITTGAARKELTLNDAALTSGLVPVATTNGRLTDSTITASKIAKPLFDHFASVGNVGTGEDDLYSDTTAAGQLATNGDKLEAEYGGTFVSSATATREIKAYFGGTMIFDTGALSLSLSAAWTAYVSIIRVSSTVIRYMVSFTTEGAALAAYTAVGEVTGLTLSGTNILKITGEAAGVGAATNDIVAMMGTISYVPAA